MNIIFRNFALAGLLVFTMACAAEEAVETIAEGEVMGEEGMMMEEEGMMMGEEDELSTSEIGEDEWANLTINQADTPDAAAQFMATNGFDRVFFDTDRSELYWRSENALKAQARFLEANPDLTVVIEGHADERGTDEYNLALGERRANAAREYLIAQGLDPFRIEVVSFGEERPVETCSDESCWSQNRRSVAVIKGAEGGSEPLAEEEGEFEEDDDDFDLGF